MSTAVVDPKNLGPHDSKIALDPKIAPPKRYRNKDGQIVTKDKDGKEVVVTPLHEVDSEVTVSGRIIAVGEGTIGDDYVEYVDVAVKALTHSPVPTLQYQVVRMDSENAIEVVPGSQVREREAKEAKEKAEKEAKDRAEAEKKAQEEAAKLAKK